jgi:starch phosphorylase
MVKPIHTIVVKPALPPALARLPELAANLRWAWDRETTELFRRLDRELWESSGHNPVRLLGQVSQEQLNAAANNAGFLAQMERLLGRLDDYMADKTSTWYARSDAAGSRLLIAYFAAEFGLTDCLPIYSGGLGVLSGDHLKSASDLGLPLVGVGLAYQKGYFRQYLNADGWQAESYPLNDFYTMPMQLERGPDGQPITVETPLPGRAVKAQIWRVQVGRIPLYLLDTNIPANSPEDQDITDQLYGGDNEMRIKQEMVLGIGGVRALRALGIQPTVYHINEGHAAFSTLERIRLLIEEQHVPFETARLAAFVSSIFTTHTSVPAGIDKFGIDLIDRYLGPYYQWLGISREDFIALGRMDAANWQEPFNMAVFAIRTAAGRNGVSLLHGDVSRAMWQPIWPKVPEDEVPIGHITNGIHTASWLSLDMANLYDRYMGPAWRDDQTAGEGWDQMAQVSPEELWQTHARQREFLVAFTRRRLRQQLQRRGAPAQEIAAADEALDPDALTIGFARRFATYKRAILLLRDPDRLARLLLNKERPVQIIFAGKSHPADNPGKEMIRAVVHLAREERFRRRIVFLEDYDINVARQLVAGADVWLNTPRRSREASGTSGMKAAANGVLNLSILDGWWDEAYSQDLGWAIGHGESYPDEAYQDQVESEALYHLLEEEVVPEFYARGSDGLPRAWINRMRNSIARLAPQFNTHRMVREYTERYYAPAFRRFCKHCESAMSEASAMAEWLRPVTRLWNQIWVREVKASKDVSELSVGEQLEVAADVFLGEIRPDWVAVDLYYGRLDPDRGITAPQRLTMRYQRDLGTGRHLFAGSLAIATSGRFGYTVRVLPSHPDLPEPMLPGLITWA